MWHYSMTISISPVYTKLLHRGEVFLIKPSLLASRISYCYDDCLMVIISLRHFFYICEVAFCRAPLTYLLFICLFLSVWTHRFGWLTDVFSGPPTWEYTWGSIRVMGWNFPATATTCTHAENRVPFNVKEFPEGFLGAHPPLAQWSWGISLSLSVISHLECRWV